MTKLPQLTVDAIYSAYEKQEAQAPRRTYLGGSALGKECRRELWYDFRHVKFEEKSGRICRLLETGHREEDRVIENLRKIGCKVTARHPQTGRQFRFTAFGGHLSGGLDGIVEGLLEAPKTAHLLEVKTANEKSFKDMKKHGVRVSKPTHYAQMQIYMGLSHVEWGARYGLRRAVYIMVNKNTDELYLERIDFDKKFHEGQMNKALLVLNSATPPAKISEDPSFWKCRFCIHRGHCQTQDTMPDKSCRNCVHASPNLEIGGWECGMGYDCTDACTEHLFIPDLLSWAEPVDGGPDHVEYKNTANGARFANVAGSYFDAKGVDKLPLYSSEELTKTLPASVGDPAVEAARMELGGEIETTKVPAGFD